MEVKNSFYEDLYFRTYCEVKVKDVKFFEHIDQHEMRL